MTPLFLSPLAFLSIFLDKNKLKAMILDPAKSMTHIDVTTVPQETVTAKNLCLLIIKCIEDL